MPKIASKFGGPPFAPGAALITGAGEEADSRVGAAADAISAKTAIEATLAITVKRTAASPMIQADYGRRRSGRLAILGAVLEKL
jgi:hypothetical protein